MATLWLVEWPERAGPALPAADLTVNLGMEGNGRVAELSAGTGQGRLWVARLTGIPEFAALSSHPM